MRNCIVVVFMILLGVTGARAATREAVLATVTPAGGVAIRDGAVVPAFPKPGGWKELPATPSDRYDMRHFLYFVPGESPALELYVCRDQRSEVVDGGFEIGLVGGFINGFAGKAGFRHDTPAFDERKIGAVTWKHTLVKLVKDRQTLWVHGYILVRKPSLTFIAIRPREGGVVELENYLAGVKAN